MQTFVVLFLLSQTGGVSHAPDVVPGSTSRLDRIAVFPLVDVAPRQEAALIRVSADEWLKRTNASLNRQVGKLEAAAESLEDSLEDMNQRLINESTRANIAESKLRDKDLEISAVKIMRLAALDRTIEARRDLEDERAYARRQNIALYMLMVSVIGLAVSMVFVLFISKSILSRLPNKTVKEALEGAENERLSVEAQRALAQEKLTVANAKVDELAAENAKILDAMRYASALSQSHIEGYQEASDAVIADLQHEIIALRRGTIVVPPLVDAGQLPLPPPHDYIDLSLDKTPPSIDDNADTPRVEPLLRGSTDPAPDAEAILAARGNDLGNDPSNNNHGSPS